MRRWRNFFLSHPRVCCAALLFAGTIALFWPAGRFGFINCDDNTYVYENVMVRRGLSWPGLAWAFTTVEGENWHPLVWISHMADAQWFGLGASGFHLTNIFLHATNVVLLFLAWRSLTGALWPSLLAAAIFAWHPMHIESVAWIAERKDVLSGLFFFLTIDAYVRFVRAGGSVPYGLMLLFFLLGLMSKPMLVTLPFLLLLLDVWPLNRQQTWIALVKEKWPLFLLSAAASFLAWWAQSQAGAVYHVPLFLRLKNTMDGYLFYLGKFFWPVHLTLFYPLPRSLVLWPALASLTVLGLATWLVCAQKRRRPYLWVGWFWFLGSLVPVIGIVQVGTQACADRYTYLPYIGLATMLAWTVAAVKQSAVKFVGGMAVILSLALWVQARVQLQFWRSNFVLYQHALNVTEGNYLAHANLGVALGMHGDLAAAADHLEEAIALSPGMASAYDNLGSVRSLQHRAQEAGLDWAAAVRLAPNNAKAVNNLAWFYATSAVAENRRGPESLQLALHATTLTRRQNPAYLDTLAAAYAETGQYDLAVKTTMEMGALAAVEKDFPLVKLAQQRLTLYQSGQPMREP